MTAFEEVPQVPTQAWQGAGGVLSERLPLGRREQRLDAARGWEGALDLEGEARAPALSDSASNLAI